MKTKMKTNFVLSMMLVLAFAIAAQAAVLVDEPFNYAEGTSVMGQGTGTGFAAASVWGSSVQGTLVMEDFGGGNIRPRMVPVSGTTTSARNLATPLTDGDDVWIGVTMDLDDQISTRFFVLALLGSSGNADIGTSSQQEWYYSGGGTFLTGVSAIDDGSGGNPGPVRLVVNLTLQAGPEAMSMWVVDEGGLIDLALPNVTAIVGDIGTLNTLRLGAGTGNGTTSFTSTGLMDDIVIGTLPTDVVGVIPEPASMMLLGLGSLVCLRRRK